jgi:heme-degrading monooxygenase HmoA
MQRIKVTKGKREVKRKWEYMDMQLSMEPGWRLAYLWKGKKTPGAPQFYVNWRKGIVYMKLRKLKQLVTL